MSKLTRRNLLRALASASVGLTLSGPLFRAISAASQASDELFMIIHVKGGWDVTLWSDPRNQQIGLVDPATLDTQVVAGLSRWTNGPTTPEGFHSFELVPSASGKLSFGPAIGNLLGHSSRLCVVNGIAMNTVSHIDGTYFSATGRHLVGGHPAASSVDTVLASALGIGQMLPVVSVQFPSAFVSGEVDARALPVRIDDIASISKTLNRPQTYDSVADREAVSLLLAAEAQALAKDANDADGFVTYAQQFDVARALLAAGVQDVFSESALKAKYPAFDYTGVHQGSQVGSAAFAIEAMAQNLVRCVSFATRTVDTHGTNYETHALSLQEVFDMLATVLDYLDVTPHPTLASAKLSEHTHILVISDFCRAPQINLTGGRDHYPNNSALVISPRFKGDFCFGKTDLEQVLPTKVNAFTGEPRLITPADVLATFLSAVGVDFRRYLRDGEPISELFA